MPATKTDADPRADEQQRVFFALWPDHRVTKRFEQLTARAAPNCTGGRATTRDKLHLTLAFMGDVAVDRIEQLTAIGDALWADAQFTGRLRIERLHWWRHNHIVWCGGEADSAWWNMLSALHRRLDPDARRFDTAGFVPHVTLLRKVSRPPRLPVIEPFDWPADEIRLVSSDLHPEGVRYRVIRSWRADQ